MNTGLHFCITSIKNLKSLNKEREQWSKTIEVNALCIATPTSRGRSSISLAHIIGRTTIFHLLWKMNPIRLERVTHSYNDRNVLTDFSITFEEKKLTAIIGKSGSGKSTLLQAINGLIRPVSGKVYLFDKLLDQKNVYSFRQKLGYLVQGTGLFPHLTIEQNISISKKIIGSSKEISPSRTEKLMDLVNLPLPYKNKYPHQLSGGEQQRVGLCRALYLDPPVLLLDEPLSALDSITRMDIRQEIIKLQQQAPRTVLFVTHDMHDAQKLADNILIIDEGRLRQYGPAAEVIAHPAAPIVESLIKAALT